MSGQSHSTDTAASFVGARRFAREASCDIDALLAQVPPDDPEKVGLQARARSHGQECGCAMGGFFLTGAVLLTVTYFATIGELRVRTGVGGVVFVFLAAGVGKLTGLLVASVKLLLLRRSLARKVQQVGAAHV